ncbi:hypothetical protein C1H46_020924 [Malus baccata]|uniref:Uncharacterized protein n=1 Tax=Malus baccata TaxID=106549 RepID=A0A540M456_MALBA|nr:hypothetical protein C1H46_020924 [Malus baccata]
MNRFHSTLSIGCHVTRRRTDLGFFAPCFQVSTGQNPRSSKAGLERIDEAVQRWRKIGKKFAHVGNPTATMKYTFVRHIHIDSRSDSSCEMHKTFEVTVPRDE